MIDAATIVVVSVLVLWSVSFGRTVDEDAPSYVRAVWLAYPVADALLLALVVRVLLSSRARSAIDAAFGVGVLLWLASDVLYLVDPHGVGKETMDAAWMVAPVLLARAAWSWRPRPRRPGRHPVVERLARRAGDRGGPPVRAADRRGRRRPARARRVARDVRTVVGRPRGAGVHPHRRLMIAEQHARAELERARDEAWRRRGPSRPSSRP